MIGETLKYYRMIQCLTQRDLAVCAGISPGCIGTIEYRNKDISLSTAAKISKALDISIDDLCRDISRDEWARAAEIRKKRMEAKEELKRKRQKQAKQRWKARQSL